jgi:hypothetical protein
MVIIRWQLVDGASLAVPVGGDRRGVAGLARKLISVACRNGCVCVWGGAD